MAVDMLAQSQYYFRVNDAVFLADRKSLDQSAYTVAAVQSFTRVSLKRQMSALGQKRRDAI